MVSPGTCNMDKKELLSVISEIEIAAHYLTIRKIPDTICSPLREDRHPSFKIYSPDGIRVKYYDYATNESGGILDLMKHLFCLNFPDTIGRIYQEMHASKANHINVASGNSSVDKELKVQILPSTRYKIRSKRRIWKDYDFHYWESYGVPKEWLLHSDIYPISHYIVTPPTGFAQVIKADKYAYTFVERKDNIISEKIYQPFNKQGRKWRSSHDKSVWDLWSKLPATGERIIITSSRKDALCIWANTHIPAVSLQSETASINPKVMDELKERFKKVYVLYDNDFENSINNGRIDGQEIADIFKIIQIEIPIQYKSKDTSDLFHNFGAEVVLQVISELVKLK